MARTTRTPPRTRRRATSGRKGRPPHALPAPGHRPRPSRADVLPGGHPRRRPPDEAVPQELLLRAREEPGHPRPAAPPLAERDAAVSGGAPALSAGLPRAPPARAARGREAALRRGLHVRDGFPPPVHLHRGGGGRRRSPRERT